MIASLHRMTHQRHIPFLTPSAFRSSFLPVHTSFRPRHMSSVSPSSATSPSPSASLTKLLQTCGGVYVPAATYDRASRLRTRRLVKDDRMAGCELWKCRRSERITMSNPLGRSGSSCSAFLDDQSHSSCHELIMGGERARTSRA